MTKLLNKKIKAYQIKEFDFRGIGTLSECFVFKRTRFIPMPRLSRFRFVDKPRYCN